MPQPDQIFFGADVLKDAQKRAQLSNAAIARAIGVDVRTWNRYKASGSVSYGSHFALVMLLELDEPAELAEDVPRTAWEVVQAARGWGQAHAELERDREEIRQLRALVVQIAEHVGLDLPADEPGSGPSLL